LSNIEQEQEQEQELYEEQGEVKEAWLAARANKKRNDNEKQTLKIGFFICIGKSNQANVKTSARHMHNIKPLQAWTPKLGHHIGEDRITQRGKICTEKKTDFFCSSTCSKIKPV